MKRGCVVCRDKLAPMESVMSTATHFVLKNIKNTDFLS